MTDTLLTHFREDMLEKLIEEAKAQGYQTVGEVYRVGNRFYVQVIKQSPNVVKVEEQDITEIAQKVQDNVEQAAAPQPEAEKPKRAQRKKKEA